jgi:hypothetical protein
MYILRTAFTHPAAAGAISLAHARSYLYMVPDDVMHVVVYRSTGQVQTDQRQRDARGPFPRERFRLRGPLP